MNTQTFSQMIQILQYLGILAIFISLIILIYRIIAYKEDVDKRVSIMQGTTRLLIGIIIIGFMVSIIGYLYFFIQKIGINGVSGSLGSPADLSKIFAPKSAVDKGSSILSNLIAGFINVIVKGITSLFQLNTINQIVFPKVVNIFTPAQWDGITALYQVMLGPTFILMAIMVFKTGFTYVINSVNPRKGEECKENLYRWIFVILMITGGLLICRFAIQIGNFLTTELNGMAQNYMPKFPIGSDINLNSALLTSVAQLYMVYITIKVQCLFIIRDIVLFIFIIFTPIVAVMWGINKNVNAIGIWIGELLSNSFMSFCMSFCFIVFGVMLNVTVNNTSWKEGYLLLFVLVGLSTTLKMVSVLRNSVQSLLTRLSGLNEEAIANSSTIGGMVAGAMGMKKTYRTAKVLGKDVKDGASKVGNTAKKGFDMGKTVGGVAATGIGKLGEAAGLKKSSSNQSFKDNFNGTEGGIIKKGRGTLDSINGKKNLDGTDKNDFAYGANDKNATSTGLNKDSIRNMAVDEIKGMNSKGAPKGNEARTKAGSASYSKMLDKIQNNYGDDVKSKMPTGLSNEGKKAWLNNKAENDLAESLGYNKPNQSVIQPDEKGIEKEHFANNIKGLNSENAKDLNQRIQSNDDSQFRSAMNKYQTGSTGAVRSQIIRKTSNGNTANNISQQPMNQSNGYKTSNNISQQPMNNNEDFNGSENIGQQPINHTENFEATSDIVENHKIDENTFKE